jgi:hypothetical protein
MTYATNTTHTHAHIHIYTRTHTHTRPLTSARKVSQGDDQTVALTVPRPGVSVGSELCVLVDGDGGRGGAVRRHDLLQSEASLQQLCTIGSFSKDIS